MHLTAIRTIVGLYRVGCNCREFRGHSDRVRRSTGFLSCLFVAVMPEASNGLPLKAQRMIKRSPDYRIQLVDQEATETVSTLPTADSLTTGLLQAPTEPQCLLHHEYAQILRRGYSDSSVRSFINRSGEIRHYVCLTCRLCPPGVRILSPCHRRRDTICGSTCVESNYVFDFYRQMCIPQDKAQDNLTLAPASTTRHQLVMLPTVDEVVFVVDDTTGDDEIIDTVDLATTPTPPHTSLGTQVTIITVGILVLDMLAIAGVALVYKKAKCKKWRQKSPAECFNNVLSHPVPHATQSIPANQPDTSSASSRVIQGEAIPSGQHRPHGEELSPQRAKESNLNIFREPGYEQSAETVVASQNDLLLASPSPAPIQVFCGKDPYRLVMIGQFGPEGGILSCEESDVILEIPPGAIPADHRNQTIIAKVSLRPDVAGPKVKNPDSLWLTPLVEFESPGLERFNKDVRMRLPHCAVMKDGWTFCVNYTNPTADTKGKKQTDSAVSNPDPEADKSLLSKDAKSKPNWFSVQQKCILTKSGKGCRKASVEGDDVTFTVDEKYFNISTPHFSKYCCTGCHKEHSLHLQAVVYWKHMKVAGREQMDLNVYILDPIKDCRAEVKQNEQGSDCHNGYQDLYFGYKKKTKEASPVEISIPEDCMGADWEWQPNTFNGCLPTKKVIEIQKLIRCCSPLLFSRHTFSFSPRNPAVDKQLTSFQAIVRIKQENWLQGDTTNILVNVPLEVTGPNGTSYKERGTFVTDAHIKLVESKLSVKNWRRLYRNLMGEGAEVRISHFEAQHPTNAAEQIHEALVDWRKSAKPQARLSELIAALEEVGHMDIVDALQPMSKGELILQSDKLSTCKETCL